jgi:branched-subunit amino acid transport protein|tara:strand:- start:438 stop:752 length:315 start_codon:yes stop_codon:yes gene_type:complete
MSIWISIIIAGIINYLTRLSSVLLIKPEKLSDNTKIILSYVPSAVFPAIIFPAVFLNDTNTLLEFDNPKIIGFIVAVIIGYVSKNIITTIIAGLVSYWIVIFLF